MTAATPARASCRHGRVAGVVGAAHPGEDDGCASVADARDPVQGGALFGQAAAGPSQGVRLPGDLGDEWVRKVS